MQSTHWWYISDDCTVASKFPKCCKHLGPNIILVKTTDSLKVESISSWVGGFNLVLKKCESNWIRIIFSKFLWWKSNKKKFETTTKILQLLLKGPSIPKVFNFVRFFSSKRPPGSHASRGSHVRTGKWKPSRSCDNLGVGWVVGIFFRLELLLRSSLNQW